MYIVRGYFEEITLRNYIFVFRKGKGFNSSVAQIMKVAEMAS